MSASPSLFAHWQRTLQAEPDARALRLGGTWLRRRDLAASAGETARSLAALGVVPRQRIILSDTDAGRWMAGFIALAEIGAVPLLFDASEKIDRVLEQGRHLRAAGAWIDGAWRPLEGGRPAPAGIALYKVTSGSTGQPRALAFTAGQMTADGRQVCAGMSIGKTDTNCAVVPLGHSYGLGNLVLPLLVDGVPFVSVETPLPHAVAQAIADAGATVLPAVPGLIAALVHSEVPLEQLGTLRLVISAGGRLAPDAAAAFRAKYGLPVHVFYGSSESGGIAYDPSGNCAEAPDGIVGTPLPGVTVSFSRRGRVSVESAAVMGSGRVLLGDLAKQHPGGEIQLLGRVGRTVKVGARRVDLAGLESEFKRALAGLNEVVIEVHPENPDRLAAVFEGSWDKAKLKAQLLSQFPRWKVPERIVIRDRFPRTSRGKIDRAAVRALLGEPRV